MYLVSAAIGVFTGLLHGAFSIVAAVIGLIFYILTAVGLHKMAKDRGIHFAWLAWIPVFQIFLVGKLDNNKVLGIPGAAWILLLFPIITALSEFFFGLGFVTGLITAFGYVYEIAAYYKLMDIYTNHPIIYTVTGVICPALMGLWIFLHRNSERDTLVAAH